MQQQMQKGGFMYGSEGMFLTEAEKEEYQYQQERLARRRKWARRKKEAQARMIIKAVMAGAIVLIVATAFLIGMNMGKKRNEIQPIIPQIVRIPMENSQGPMVEQLIEISTIEEIPQSIPMPVSEPVFLYPVTAQEVQMFEGIVAAEGAHNWEYADYLTIATVIINRYNSSSFADNFYDILTEDLQFDTYANGRYQTVNVSEACRQAVWDALNGKVNLNSEVMWFCTKNYYDNCKKNDFFRTLNHVYTCRNTYFFTK